MPPATVNKWAKEAGMSSKEAERRWDKAKALAAREGRNPEITKQQDDWRYVMGIFKTMMGKKSKPAAESLIDRVLEGESPSDVLQILQAGSVARLHVTEGSIGTGDRYVRGESIKTFFDGYGELRFSSDRDVLIDPSSDNRMLELMQYADALSVDNPLFDLLECFEGSLSDLYQLVTRDYTLIDEI